MTDDANLTALTPQQVSELTSIPLSTIYKMIEARDLPVIRTGRTIRIRRSTLERWLEAKEQEHTNRGTTIPTQIRQTMGRRLHR